MSEKLQFSIAKSLSAVPRADWNALVPGCCELAAFDAP